MGLDMYLRGEKFFWTNWDAPEKNRHEDGLKVSTLVVELGYWRKHSNLHGYIVKEFGGGVDECQRIELSLENLKAIIDATKANSLPETSGFFFGKSTPEDDADTIKQVEAAITWLETKEDNVSRDVFYEASW